MGLRSFSIVFDGTMPCLKEVLYMFHKTGANSQANSFQILLGTTSGPEDLFNINTTDEQ